MDLPLWMIGDIALIVFGVLAAAEWFSEGNRDIQVLLEGAKTHMIKPGVNGVLQFGLAQGQAMAVLELLVAYAPAETLNWLVHLSPAGGVASVGAVTVPTAAEALAWLVPIAAAIWAVLLAGLTWLLASFRQVVVDTLGYVDTDGHLGLIKLFRLRRSLWGLSGEASV